ncbi:unnamed protein product [Prorocentrum cordatum]|uniref:Uncharacterized protein n=1 Tax=Prorocentrum cordatum TaxID=2364126 RepID=A0ABN9PP26_9DINO|nr:unnamed protein product [Polarella glacialis]
MWMENGWVKTNDTVWDCEEIIRPCSPNGASCAITQCCSEPGSKCYKKNEYWSSCNKTCDSNTMWIDGGWVKTDEAVWDCEDLSLFSAEGSTDSESSSDESAHSDNLFDHDLQGERAVAISSTKDSNNRSGAARPFLCFALSVGLTSSIALFFL